MNELGELVRREQPWLIERIVEAARENGFDVQGPRLQAAWMQSLCRFREPLELAIERPEISTRLDATTDYGKHPLTAFGIETARTHRARGVTLTRFLALFKHYRRAHIELLDHAGITGATHARFLDFLHSVFDIVEIGVVTEWAALDRDARLAELEVANRLAVAERLKYVTVFESLATPGLILDGADRIEHVNLAALRLFDEDCAPGTGYYDDRVPAALADQIPALLRAAQEERPAKLATGRGERHFRVTAHRLLDVGEPRPGCVLLLADVTDYVSELAAASLVNRAKSAFIATVSHDIRTPLNGILHGLALLGLEQPGSHETAAVDAIRTSAQSLLGLVDDILDHSRIEQGVIAVRTEPVHVRDLIDKAIAVLAPRVRAKGLELETDIALDPELVLRTDGAKVQRILINLLDNAAKFTLVGHIGCSARYLADEASLVITVSDTGPGFAEGETSALFAPFVQRSRPGAVVGEGIGLGLAICRALTDALNGTLDVESRPGTGSRFTLRLPVSAAAGDTSRTEVFPSRAPVAGTAPVHRVLLIEDNEVTSMLVAELMRRGGFEVTLATTASEGWRRVTEAKMDAVVLDVRLPDGDGAAVARQLRRHLPDTPLIALTADAGADTEAACLAAGVDAFLRKPVPPDLLNATLKRLIGDGKPMRPPRPVGIDEQRLAGHVKVLGSGGMERVLRAFDGSIEATNEALRAVAAPHDLPRLVERLHALQGAASQLGLAGLGQRCFGLEMMATAGDVIGIDADREAFMDELLRARADLHAQTRNAAKDRL